MFQATSLLLLGDSLLLLLPYNIADLLNPEASLGSSEDTRAPHRVDLSEGSILFGISRSPSLQAYFFESTREDRRVDLPPSRIIPPVSPDGSWLRPTFEI